MKRLMLSLMFAAGLLLLAPAPQAEASSWGWSSGGEQPALTWGSSWRSRRRARWQMWRRWRHNQQKKSVPELDASTAGSAMVLLLGGVAYIASRRREEDGV